MDSGRRGSRRLGLLVGTALAVALAPAGAARAGLNTWTSTGPTATSIQALATDPLTVGPVYAGTNGAGMYKSIDGGQFWFQVNTGLTNFLIRAVVVNPQNSTELYVGTSGEGVFKSTDAGVSWAPASAGLTNPLVNALVVDPQTPTTLYAGTAGGGVFKSTNGGGTWSGVNVGLTNQVVAALAIDPQVSSTLYAGTTGQGVFKSSNGGASWAPASTGLVNMLVAALVVDPQTPATLYAGTSGGGVFRSTDGAGNWAAVNTGLVNTIVRTLAVDPRAPATLYAGTTGGGVFMTVNAGASWAAFNPGLTDLAVNALAVTLFGTCVHAGTVGGGVFDLANAVGSCGPSPLAAAVLPVSRSVQTGATATAFATIINSGPVQLEECGIAAPPGFPGAFLFQTTNPVTNQLTGTPNTGAIIDSKGGAQTFLIAFTPAVGFAPTDVPVTFGCANAPLAPGISGVNSLLLSASPTAVPDIIAVAVTLPTDASGVVSIPGPTGTGAFAVATINIGASASITAMADTGVAALPVTITLCETNPAGACLAPAAATVTRTINTGQTPTYAVYVKGSGTVGFNPSLHRIYVRFKDAGGAIRGSTSLAGQTQ